LVSAVFHNNYPNFLAILQNKTVRRILLLALLFKGQLFFKKKKKSKKQNRTKPSPPSYFFKVSLKFQATPGVQEDITENIFQEALRDR